MPMPKLSVQEVKAELDTHEAVCAERWKETILRIKRIEHIMIGTAGTTTDSKDVTSASVSYAVAAGVTAILGYTDVDSSDEGANDTTDGSAWYIGANMSF